LRGSYGCRCSAPLGARHRRREFRPSASRQGRRGTTDPARRKTPPTFCPNQSARRSRYAPPIEWPASRAAAARSASQTSPRTNGQLRDGIGTSASASKLYHTNRVEPSALKRKNLTVTLSYVK